MLKLRPYYVESRRAEILERLYRHSGRTNWFYTGLWEEQPYQLQQKLNEILYCGQADNEFELRLNSLLPC